MIEELFFIKEPVQFSKDVYVYPPSVKEVLKAKHFDAYLKLLTTSQEEIEDEYVKNKQDIKDMLTPLETLLSFAYNNKEVNILIREAFKFFLHQDVSFLFEQKKIVVGDLKQILPKLKSVDDLFFINEDNFFDLQNLIRQSVGKEIVDPPNPNEHWKIKQMKARARYRDKIKAKQKNKDGLPFKTVLTSICCMGIGITPLNIGEISYMAIPDIMRTFQERDKYEVDIKSVMAGAKKVKPKYWIRKIED